MPFLFQEGPVKTMRKIAKTMLRLLLWIVAIIIFLILICFVYHRYRLTVEEKLRKPLGQLIDINGKNMSIYVEGRGSKTLVFLSGAGTCSPILDFKSLYSLLSDKYRIAVVEKFGYGYSDIVNEDRNIQTILSETRLALHKAGIDGPYILCPLLCLELKHFIGLRNTQMKSKQS